MTAFALFELPKPALAAILSALDSQDRERLPHVCHAWHSGFYKEPLCNRQLSVHRLVIDGCCLWLLGGGAPLQALAGLQSLSVRLPSTASWELCECIARCRPLTELELFNVPAGDSAEVLQPLEHLTSLRRLVLRAEMCTETEFPDAIVLGRPAGSWGTQPDVPLPLRGLRLTHLTVTSGARAHSGLGRPLNALSGGDDGYDGSPEVPLMLGEGLAELPLRELHLDGPFFHEDTELVLPADLWRCTGLTRLVVRGRACLDDDQEFDPCKLPPLDGARLPHLRALSLNACALWGGVVPAIVSAAPHLTALALTEAELWPIDDGPYMCDFPDLSRLAGLQELDLSGARYMRQDDWAKLWPALASLQGLHSLKLACCDVQELPEVGPYSKLERLDLSQNYLLECPAWLPAACPLLRHLGLAFNGSQQGNYEDPRPMILTDAVRQLATRTDGTRLQSLSIPSAHYLSVRRRQFLEDPAELAAAAIFDELVTLQEAGRLALVVADQRFPEEYEEPAQEGSWLA